MFNATPTSHTTTKNETVNRIAEGFAKKRVVKLGAYFVTRLVAGWTTKLTFTHVGSGKTHCKDIASDGPTHAAEQAYEWWTKDAWRC